MIKNNLWQNLKSLVECDQFLLGYQKDLESLELSIADNYHMIETLRKSVEDRRLRYVNEKKNVDFQELQAADLKNKEDQKRQRLESIVNQKEYKAIKSEIENVIKEREDQENLVMSSWHSLESAKLKLEATDKENSERINALLLEINKQEKSLKELGERLSTQAHAREALAQAVPQEWIAKYERMKHSVSNPIVPIIKESCSACFYNVLKQDIAKLKQSALVLCRNCYRFLYYDQEEEKDSKKSTY